MLWQLLAAGHVVPLGDVGEEVEEVGVEEHLVAAVVVAEGEAAAAEDVGAGAGVVVDPVKCVTSTTFQYVCTFNSLLSQSSISSNVCEMALMNFGLLRYS